MITNQQKKDMMDIKLIKNLSRQEVIWEFLEVLFQRTLLGKELNESTIVLDFVSVNSVQVFFSVQTGETPFLRDNDLLLTWELVSSSSQSFDSNVLVVVLGSDREDNLTNVNSGS